MKYEKTILPIPGIRIMQLIFRKEKKWTFALFEWMCSIRAPARNVSQIVFEQIWVPIPIPTSYY